MSALHQLDFPTAEAAAAAMADWAAGCLVRAVAKRGKASLAVPGGSTPSTFLRLLADKPVPWGDVTVLLTDERLVPSDHARSNERMLKSVFHLIADRKCHYISLAEAVTGPSGLDRVSEAVLAVAPLDVCICGMGEDAHTASLFPGDRTWIDVWTHAYEGAGRAGAAVILTHPENLEPRISLTPSMLVAAANRAVLMNGENKRQVLKEALDGKSVPEAPVLLLSKGDGQWRVYAGG